MRDRITLEIALVVGLVSTAAIAQSPAVSSTDHPTPQGTQLDLQKAFRASSPWLLVVTEGAPVKDYADNDAPGALTLCLQKGPGGRCLSDAVTPVLRTATPDGAVGWEPHYLLTAKVVYPRGPRAAPFLLLVTGSMYSADGDKVVATQLLAYDSGRDAFRRLYNKSTGHNNNQEIRFIDDGPLRGSVITAEPQEHLPYGYWIVVETLTQTGDYRQVLRYLSATRYADGNPLAVIDSEMPTIERRLGLWKPGEPLPTPSSVRDGKRCSKPTLKHAELWCE